MPTQSEPLTFPAALARFHRPGMHAAYIVKLADEMLREITDLQNDICSGALDITGLSPNAQAHLRAALQDVETYAADAQQEIGRAQDLLRSF
jgi:hypothetical protein